MFGCPRSSNRAPVLHSAVNTARGLHVTPTAFAWSGGACWFVVSQDSVKARALRKRPRVGLLLHSRNYDLVAVGNARLFGATGWPSALSFDRLLDVPFVPLGYTARN